jgi:single-stranded DNA-binding protein
MRQFLAQGKIAAAQGPPLRFGLAPPTALRFYWVLWRSSRKAIANGASPQRWRAQMKNFAEFQILGRVGKIKEFDGKVNVTVCANYPTKKDGETRDNPHWNEVSIFAEAVRGYATKYAKAGDLVYIRGRIKQNSFERNGEKVYTVDMVAEEFSILASKAEKADESSEQSQPAKKPARGKK